MHINPVPVDPFPLPRYARRSTTSCAAFAFTFTQSAVGWGCAVFRLAIIAGFAAVSLGSTGCAGTWDTITSRSFRKDPWNATVRMIQPEDPLAVLLADPPRSGDDRAKAMRRLKEPLNDNRTQPEQDQVIDVLARAAIGDASPILRLSAIEALGKFEDPRAVGILVMAYDSAHGRSESEKPAVATTRDVIPAGGPSRGNRGTTADRFPLSGPTGFPPDTVAAIRCRSAEALGRTGRPEAVQFLATVAAGSNGTNPPAGADDVEIRQAAIRGLGKCRQPEAVNALAQVLAAESGKNPSTVMWAHDGLMRLTGKRLPADPKQWNEVVQAGVVIAPEPNFVQNAIEWVRP
jgi:hypothetical protein